MGVRGPSPIAPPRKDLPGATGGLISQALVKKENERLEEIGVGRPLKDELELNDYMPEDKELPGDITSEEESEMNGQPRPKRGSVCLGYGATMLPLRKGTPKPFVDAAGRWPVQRRKHPADDIAINLQGLVLDALKAYAQSLL